MKITRREFIKKSALGIALVGASSIFDTAAIAEKAPSPKFLIKVCNGRKCHNKNNKAIIDAIKKKVNIKENKQVSEDGRFKLELTGCMGNCGQGPIVVINDKIYLKATPDAIVEALGKLK